jgi:hypothetical protein
MITYSTMSKKNFLPYFDYGAYAQLSDKELSPFIDSYVFGEFKRVFKITGVSQENWKELISLDKRISSWYTNMKADLLVLQSLPSDFMDEDVPSDVRDLVILDLSRIKEARLERFTETKIVAESFQSKLREIDLAYNNKVKGISNYARVASADISYLPVQQKIALLKFKPGSDERADLQKNLIRAYKKDLYKILKANGGLWGDNPNPFQIIDPSSAEE